MSAFTLRCDEDMVGSSITYTADNFTSIQVDYRTPITPMPLPQSEDKENILIKVEGNTTMATVSWKVRDLDSTPFSGGVSRNNNSGSSINTAAEIIEFFKTDIVPVTVSDSYTLTIGVGSSAPLVLEGTLMSVSFSISSMSPVVWTGTMQFVHGNVASTTDPDLADSPTYSNIVDDNDSSGHGIQIVSAATGAFGVDSGITGYIVQYRASGGTSWSNFSTITYLGSGGATQATSQTVKATGITSAGNYDIRFTAKTSTNANGNKWSVIKNNVAVQ